VVTEQPPVVEIKVTFEGDCNDVVGNAEAEQRFKEECAKAFAAGLGISKSSIAVDEVECGSIIVTFTVIGASVQANVSDELQELVQRGQISVTVNNKTYTANNVEVVPPTTQGTQAPTTEASKNEVAFILYITFGALMGLIFIVGIIVLILRCRKDRREGGFFLNPETNYELRRFHGIPRANDYSKVNYYGDPVELDATAADPDAPDEFQAQPGVNPYTQGSSLDRVKPIAAASSDEKFNVGAMGLPEWKNLPKLSKSDVTIADDPKQGIPKSSGSVSSRQHLLDDDSLPTYDNPIVTFGNGTSGLEKKENSEYAYDNPVITVDEPYYSVVTDKDGEKDS